MAHSDYAAQTQPATAGVGYYRTCPKCGNKFPPRRDSTNTGLCMRCTLENAANAAIQLHNRSGEYYERSVKANRRHDYSARPRNADGTFAQHGRGDQADTASR